MDTCEQLADDELVALLQQGELSAFIKIYNRYWFKLYSSAYKRLKNNEASEEIVQDVFTNFWKNRNELKLQVGLSNYLFIATRNEVFNYYRKQLIRNKFALYSLRDDYDNSNEQIVLLRDLQHHIEQLVNRLPNKCQLIYRLSRVENRTNKEIAALLNISEKTVEGHLTKALKQLRLNLANLLAIISAIILKIFF